MAPSRVVPSASTSFTTTYQMQNIALGHWAAARDAVGRMVREMEFHTASHPKIATLPEYFNLWSISDMIWTGNRPGKVVCYAKPHARAMQISKEDTTCQLFPAAVATKPEWFIVNMHEVHLTQAKSPLSFTSDA